MGRRDRIGVQIYFEGFHVWEEDPFHLKLVGLGYFRGLDNADRNVNSLSSNFWRFESPIAQFLWCGREGEAGGQSLYVYSNLREPLFPICCLLGSVWVRVSLSTLQVFLLFSKTNILKVFLLDFKIIFKKLMQNILQFLFPSIFNCFLWSLGVEVEIFLKERLLKW